MQQSNVRQGQDLEEVVVAPLGAQTPRILILPEGEEHPKWDEVLDFVDKLGVTLDEWQWDVLHAALLRSEGFWAAFTVAVCCPRQNGKNSILEIRELIGAIILGEKTIVHTAHLADTSMEAFRRLDDLIDANDWLSGDVKHIWRTNGRETIEFKNGCRIRFRTRTRGGGRGYSASPVVFDESMFLPDVSVASILPVVSAQEDPQLWYMGSAVDQETMDDGVAFARVRERAINGDHERLAYFEWSLDYPLPDEIPDDLDLHEAAAATNPAYGRRITPSFIEAEAREFGYGSRALAVERLGVGDWPDTDRAAGMVINPAAWSALVDPSSKPHGPVILAFDVAPDRSRGTISASGIRKDGLFHLEVVERREGTGWIAPRLGELLAKHKVDYVVCDSKGPAASLVLEIGAKVGSVREFTTEEYVEACGFLFDTVERGELRHLGSPEVLSAIRGAQKRPLGDAWAWSRKNSTTDITPLVSFTLALAVAAEGGGGLVY